MVRFSMVTRVEIERRLRRVWCDVGLGRLVEEEGVRGDELLTK
jgi:hypothetical protein